MDSNAVAPAEDPQGVAGHHGEVFLDPVLDADLDPFDDFAPTFSSRRMSRVTTRRYCSFTETVPIPFVSYYCSRGLHEPGS